MTNIKKYRDLVSEAVNTADLWYLAEIEAPKDEYVRQTQNILSLILNRKLSQDNVEEKINKNFYTKEHALDPEKIRYLKTKILDILDEYIKSNKKT